MIEPRPASNRPGVPRWAYLIVLALAVVAITLPYQVWQDTWFGKNLSADEIASQLSNRTEPRKVQHALEQLSRRTVAGGSDLKRFEPLVLSLVDHKEPSVRLTVAWLMGEDGKNAAYQQALGRLVNDEELIVRQNAALALSRFGNASGRSVLLDMLGPTMIASPAKGTVDSAWDRPRIAIGGRLFRVRSETGETVEIKAPIDGTVEERRVKNGTKVDSGDILCWLRPESSQVFHSLRALLIVGTEEDLEPIDSYARGNHAFGEEVTQQAAETQEAIRKRG